MHWRELVTTSGHTAGGSPSWQYHLDRGTAVKKLKLNLDDLVVESFETVAPPGPPGGTVVGHTGNCTANAWPPDYSCNYVDFTCNGNFTCQEGCITEDGGACNTLDQCPTWNYHACGTNARCTFHDDPYCENTLLGESCFYCDTTTGPQPRDGG